MSTPYAALLLMLQVLLGKGDCDLLESELRSQAPAGLQERAKKEGLSGILADFGERWGLSLDTAEVEQIVDDKRAYRLEYFRLNEALKEAGIALLVLKGAALGASIYSRCKPRWRPLRDLDLMVESGQFRIAEKVLLDLGYRKDPSGYLRGRLSIDFHTDLLGASRIPARSKVFQFDSEQLWRDSRALHPGLAQLRVLSGPHQFCHLAVHALKHSQSRLIWLVDLALLYPTLEPEELWRFAVEFRAERAAAIAFQILKELLNIPLAPSHETRLPRFTFWERRYISWLKEGRQPEVMGELLCVLQARDARSRAAYLLELMFPPGGPPLGVVSYT